MQTETQNAATVRFAPPLTQLLAVGWVAVGAFVYLFGYDGWLVPVQSVRLLGAALPTLSIGSHFAEFWQARLLDAGCVAAILITSFAVGAVAVDRWTPEKNLLAALYSLAAGLWGLSVTVLLVGLVSVRSLPFVFALAGAWLWPVPRRFLHRARSALPAMDGWSKVMLACLVVAAVLYLPGAMAPPFEYDELEYHLGSPAEYVKAGRIVALPHNFYSNLPQLTEMLYLLALKVGSGVAAKLLHWSLGLLSAIAVYAVAARLWSRRIAVTAAVLFYCQPFVGDLSQTARIDLGTTFFAVLAFGALLLWRSGNEQRPADAERRWLLLSALAAGAAVATKWPAVPVVLLPAAACVLVIRRSVLLTAIYCLPATVVVLPWLAKNWVLMGNPFYPLFNNVFHSPHWTAEQAAVFAERHYATLDWDGWKQLAGLAWQYSFREPYALPLLWMTAPLVLLLKNASPSARRAGWLFVTAYAGWFLVTFRPWRFLFPAFPLAAIIGAVALDAVGRGTRVVVMVILLVGLLGMGLGCLIDAEDPDRVPPQVNDVNHALGQVSAEEFVARMGHGTFESIVWMNHHLPADATVLYVGEARTFYARHRVLWSTAFDRHPLDALARSPADDGRLWQELRARGITHVYVNFSEWERLRVHYGYLLDLDTNAFQHLLMNHAREIHASGRNKVWELSLRP